MLKPRLKIQYVALFSLLIVLISSSLSALLINQFSIFAKKNSRYNTSEYANNSINRATEQSIAIVEQLADNLANHLYYFNMSEMGQLIEVALALPEVSSVQVLNSEFQLIHAGGLFHKSFGENVQVLAGTDPLSKTTSHTKSAADELEIISPILVGDESIGWVVAHYSLKNILHKIEQQTQSIEERHNKNFTQLIALCLIVVLILLIAGITIAYIMASHLEKPINKLVSHAQLIGHGSFNTRVEINRSDELGDLADSLNKMAGDLAHHTEEIQYLAFHDTLTNLPNRRYLLESLDSIVNHCAHNGRSFSLLFVDIDNFKTINDSYGHDAGDFILTAVVERIRQPLRPGTQTAHSHTYEFEQPTIARLAGDEFVIILPDTDKSFDAAAVSEKILGNLSQEQRWNDKLIPLSVSIGIAVYPANGTNAETLLRNADTAMYHVKQREKNGYYFFSEALNREAIEKRQLLNELTQAMSNLEFELWYQPQFNLNTGEIVGAEALVRWVHPEKGLIKPDEFIPTIENSELIHQFGLWVIRQAIVFLRSCRTIYPDISISINLSASQLQNENSLMSQLEKLNIESALADKLHLEITETFLLTDEEQAKSILGKLQKSGFKVWLDDFGTGYSALSHLKNYPVDGLKIDRSFVNGLESEWENKALTQAILSVADALEIQAIAEGVETTEQSNALKEMGCQVAQGYLFARPMPEQEFISFLTSNLTDAC